MRIRSCLCSPVSLKTGPRPGVCCCHRRLRAGSSKQGSWIEVSAPTTWSYLGPAQNTAGEGPAVHPNVKILHEVRTRQPEPVQRTLPPCSSQKASTHAHCAVSVVSGHGAFSMGGRMNSAGPRPRPILTKEQTTSAAKGTCTLRSGSSNARRPFKDSLATCAGPMVILNCTPRSVCWLDAQGLRGIRILTAFLTLF